MNLRQFRRLRPRLPAALQCPDAALATTAVDYSRFFPPVGNQGTSSTCATFSGVYAIFSALVGLANQNNPAWTLVGNGPWANNPQTTFSPRFTYNQASVNGGVDKGAHLISVLQSLREIGAVPLSVVPFSATDSPSVSYLTQANLYLASQFRLKAYYNVGTSVQTLKNYLSQGYPIYMAMMVDDVPASLTAANPVYSAYDGSSRGGHAMVFVGYDDSVAGGSFKVLNSWGTSHALNGYFYLPYSFWSNGALGTEALIEQYQ